MPIAKSINTKVRIFPLVPGIRWLRYFPADPEQRQDGYTGYVNGNSSAIDHETMVTVR